MGYFSASLAAATKNFYDRVDLTLNPPAVGSVTNMPVSGLGAGTDGYYYGGAASPPVDEGGDQCATWTGPVPFTAGAIAYVVHGTTEVNALAPTTASRPVSILELDASTGIDLRSRESGGLPVVASGGAGHPLHLIQAIQTGHADAVLAASIFHFGEFTIQETKRMMAEHGIPVRL